MATPKQQPPYLGEKRTLKGKPVIWAGDGWGWQTPATYTRLAGEGRLNTQKNPLNWIDNNLQHLFKTSNQLNKGTKLVGTVGFLPIYEEPGGGVSSSTPAQRQVAAAVTVNAPANAALAATNLGQRLLSGQPLKPSRVKAEDTQVGRAIVSARTQATVGMGAKPAEQLTQTQRDLLVSLPSSLATNTALAFVAPLRAGGAAVGGLASKLSFLSPGAQQVLARGLSWGTNAAVNEAASGLLDDSTQGQAGDLLKAVGAPVPDAFVTQPGDDRIQAGLRGIVPGIAFGEALGLPLGVASKALDLAPNAMRLLREQRVNGDVTRVRQSTVAAGIQTPDALGGYQFNRDLELQGESGVAPSPRAAAPVAEPMPAAAAAPTTPAGTVEPVSPAPGVEAPLQPSPEVDLEQVGDSAMDGIIDNPDAGTAYDPSLLEVDAAALALDRLDDGALTAVAAGGGPVLPRLEEAMATQPRPDVNPERSTLWTAAPAESLVTPQDGWRSQWEQLPNTELIGAAAPTVSPDLFERTQALTGKQWEDFTRADVLDGLGDLEQSGQVVMPQRLGEGQVLADVQGLQVDPARMQFRGGADPESGVAPGGPEINQWDVSKEGRVSIWQDPGTGDQILVDGHRRVDAARRLGIPTIPADELVAPTADAARLQGANRNVAEGSASPLDGGRALRQQGITDQAGLEAAGLSMDEGSAAGGTAMARLPEPVFRAAETGELPEVRAMAIGGSELDEAGMAAAAKFSGTQAGQALNDLEFGELMSLSGPQSRPNPLAQVEAVKQELDSTGSYYAGPLKLDREVYDNGSSRTTAEVATAEMLPAEFLAAKGVADSTQLSTRRQMTLLREFTMQELRKLPPGDYYLDALTEKHASIYSRWFDGGKTPGIAAATDQLLAGNSWTYRPQDDPKSLVSMAARQDAAPAVTPTAITFKERVSEAKVAAAVRRQMPAELRQMFDATKRQDGPVAQLLAQGGAEVAAGARPDVVASRIRLQVERAAEATQQASPESAVAADMAPGQAAAPGPMTAADRQALRAQLLQQAIDGGEVRPSAQPVIPSPDPLSVDPIEGIKDLESQLRNTGTIQPDTPAAKLLEEEARLAGEYEARDAFIANEMARAQREAAGFWDMSFDERVRQGLLGDGWKFPAARDEVLQNSGVVSRNTPNAALDDFIRQVKNAGRDPDIPEAHYGPVIIEWDDDGGGKAFHLSPLEYLPDEGLAAMGLDRIDVEMMSPRQQLARLKEVFDEVRAALPPGEYKLDPLEPSLRALVVRTFKSDPDVSWFDLETGKPSKPGMNSYGMLDVKQSAEGPTGSRAIPESMVKPYESLTKLQEPRAVNDLQKALGTHEAGLDQNGGLTYARRKMELRGQVDLDSWLGAETAQKVREQFRSGELGAEAVEVRAALRDFYGFKASTNEKPAYIELGGDDAAINRLSDLLRDTVRMVAGTDADVRLMDRYKYEITNAEWGGDGKRVGRIHGSYELMRDVVSINGVLDGTTRQLMGTAYHEAFHRVQYGLLTTKEMKVLDSAFGLERINNYSQLSPAKVSSLERMAVAFQNYATAKTLGGDAMQANMLAQLDSQLKDSGITLGDGTKNVVVQVAMAFEKVLDFVDRIKNFAKGNGFDTVDSIFERVYSGKIAQQRAFDSALELLTSDQTARAKTLQRWRKDNKAPVQDIDAALSNLDAQIESLKAKALSGGC